MEIQVFSDHTCMIRYMIKYGVPMCYPSQGLFAVSLIKFYNIVSHTSTLLPFLPPYFLFFFLPLFSQTLANLLYPVSPSPTAQWKVMKLYRNTTVEISIKVHWQAYPFSSLSVSVRMRLYMCTKYYVFVCVLQHQLHMYVCTHICCSLRSVVYSVELTVKILALGPHCFFTKAWNV